MLTFANPIWLIALIPWLALSIWLIIVRRPRADVPFIQLWQTSENQPARSLREKIQPPPFALMCALLAMLIALIAAARPMIGATTRGPITIIVDRGVTMGGTNLHDIGATISKQFESGPVELVQVPGSNLASDGSSWLEQLSPATGVDSREMLLSAIASSRQFTIVVSNQDLPATRAVQVIPDSIDNVGVARISARILPKPAVLVRVRNNSDQQSATLRVNGQSRPIALPTRGGEQDFFFDLPDAPDVIDAQLVVADANPADNRAWLVKRASWPGIELRAAVPPALERFIDVYLKRRPAGSDAPTIIITDNPQRARADQVALIVESGTSKVGGPIQVVDHPITRNVRDWSALTDAKPSFDVAQDRRAVGEGWSAIVSAGDLPLVSVRENPARQVYISADLTTFARSSDFVVLFTNVFDWLAGATSSDEYRGEPVSDDALRWTRVDDLSGSPTTAPPSPGVYRDVDGKLHALDAIAGPTTKPSTDWKAALRDAAKHLPRSGGSVEISRYLILAALGLIALSTLFWRSKSRGKAGAS